MNKEYSETLYGLKRIFHDSETPKLIEHILSNTLHTSSIQLLDIGSGDLSGLTSIAKRLKKYKKVIVADALDVHHPSIRKSLPSNLSVNRIVGDFKSIRLTKKYDIVLCRQSLYYLGNQKIAIKKMCSLLRDNGFTIVITWDKNCHLRKLCAKYQPDSYSSGLSKSKLENIGKSLGLKFKSFSFSGTVDIGKFRKSNQSLTSFAKLILRGPRTSARSIKKLTEDLATLPKIIKRANAVVIYNL